MAPAYKLTYFNVTALAEPIRFLLNYGGIEFEDVRIDRQVHDWPALKPTFPFGQLPVLEFNGRIVHQSIAITRYVAKQVKLNGKDDWEDLEIDSAVETINDLRIKISNIVYESHEIIEKSADNPLLAEALAYYLEKLDAQVKQNNGHFACGRLTWADFYFVGILNYLNYMAKRDVIEGYPNLVSLNELVLALPAIKTWIEKRPVTEL